MRLNDFHRYYLPGYFLADFDDSPLSLCRPLTACTHRLLAHRGVTHKRTLPARLSDETGAERDWNSGVIALLPIETNATIRNISINADIWISIGTVCLIVWDEMGFFVAFLQKKGLLQLMMIIRSTILRIGKRSISGIYSRFILQLQKVCNFPGYHITVEINIRERLSLDARETPGCPLPRALISPSFKLIRCWCLNFTSFFKKKKKNWDQNMAVKNACFSMSQAAKLLY